MLFTAEVECLFIGLAAAGKVLRLGGCGGQIEPGVGGGFLFGGEAARAAAGNYVLDVLWFNFLAGFAYVVAGAGLWLRQRWAVWLAIAIAVATVLTFAALGVYVYSGAAYELRTVIAMGLRITVWGTIAAVAWRSA